MAPYSDFRYFYPCDLFLCKTNFLCLLLQIRFPDFIFKLHPFFFLFLPRVWPDRLFSFRSLHPPNSVLKWQHIVLLFIYYFPSPPVFLKVFAGLIKGSKSIPGVAGFHHYFLNLFLSMASLHLGMNHRFIPSVPLYFMKAWLCQNTRRLPSLAWLI